MIKLKLLKRLFATTRNEPFFSLFQILGFRINNKELYETALRHRSKSKSGEDKEMLHNERLEFLGDSLYNSIITEYLYDKFKNEDEGSLSAKRSAIIQRKTMNKISREIGLDKIVIVNKQVIQQNSENIYGNALEAIIAAIYIDKGYRQCQKFITKKIIPSTSFKTALSQADQNYKSKLLEWAQEKEHTIRFATTNEIRDSNNHPSFTCKVFIDEEAFCSGSGRSKKEAHQQASMHTLKQLKQL